MDEKAQKSTLPVLSYANPPTRHGSLLLANLVAICGMCLWLLGLILIVPGFGALFYSVLSLDMNGVGISFVVLLIGAAICALAFWLCRMVRGIADGYSAPKKTHE